MCDRRRKTTAGPKKKVVRPMPICSFCLDDEKCNRNGQPEEFISCVDCGNSGHPSCLKFSVALTQRVKQTRWQCIDCKRCAKCKGIGRDENMLFCDSCDRGVHMKCCSPPLKELPPGEWFCFLCESKANEIPPCDNDGSVTNRQSLVSSAATKQNKPDRKCLSNTQKPKGVKFKTRNCALVTIKKCAQRYSRKLSQIDNTPSQVAKTDLTANSVLRLNDGLTQFFTPSNKRKTRVSSVSLEGIVATRTDSSTDCHTKWYGKQKATGVVLRASHHQAANRLIKKSQHIQRKQIQKRNEEQKMNYQLRALAALHDGLTTYFTARGKRRSRFRRTERTLSPSSSIQDCLPASAKRQRRTQRGDQVELLFDGLTHFFTAQGKRPSVFRKPDEESRERASVRMESLIERRKRQHKHRTQVQLLFDGLSRFFTARNAKRSEESIKSSRPFPTRKMSSGDSKDDAKVNSEQRKCRKRKLEDIYDNLQQLSLTSNAKRVRSSASALSNSQRVASRIVEKSRQFRAKKETKKVVRRRRGESCQLKSLFDGLSHLYTAHGERQRKSFNFYCLSVRHQTRTGGVGSSVGTAKLENAKELCKKQKLAKEKASVKSMLSQTSSGSTEEADSVKEDDLKASKVVSKNSTVNKKVTKSEAECLAMSGKKMRKRTLSRSEVKGLSDGVTKEDIKLFSKAKDDSHKRFISQEGRSALELGPAQTGPGCIEIGKYEITAWHCSPYPLEYASLSKLYVCEFCLKCFKSRVIVKSHMTKCVLYHPPGDEIYRSGSLSVYEVDGKVNKQYCQNLCLLAKLFLDHKTLYYDVEPFLFYVLTHTDDGGSHLIGYFSKEKYCQQKYNLSCIMTLPPYQRQGYGRFLIEFSYLLSRLEGQPGSPEKPLSELGRVSYSAFWKSVVVEYLHKQKNLSNISIQSISEATGLMPGDIVTTLQSLDFMLVKDSMCVIAVRQRALDEHLVKVKARQDSRIPLKEEALRWSPFVAILGNEKEEKAVAEKAEGKRQRGRDLKGTNNDVDAFVAEKKCLLRKRSMAAESYEEHEFDRGFNCKVIKEDSCKSGDVSMGKNAQADDIFNRQLKGQQFLDSVPRENGDASEEHCLRRRLRKSSFTSGKKMDRGRVSCNNRSPQVEKDYPNKPRKRTKNSYSALCNLATKERQGSSVECQSESRDSSEKSAEVSDEMSTSWKLSHSLDNQFGNEGVRQLPHVVSVIDSGKRMTPSFDLLPDNGDTSSSEGQDAEEVDEDCVAKVKNLRSIVDVELGNEILPGALNATRKALCNPYNDIHSLTDEVIATNQDEGFSSSAEDGLDSVEIGVKVRHTQEDRISRIKKKQDSVLFSGYPNVTVQNELTEMKVTGESLVSESSVVVTRGSSGDLAGSELEFTARGYVGKVLAENVSTSSLLSEKLYSQVDTNLLPNLDSNMLPVECGKKGLPRRDGLFVSISASSKAGKGRHRLLTGFEEFDVPGHKHVDFRFQRAGGLLRCMEVAKEDAENSRTSRTTGSPHELRKKAVCSDLMATENSVDKALQFGELSVVRTRLGEDRREVDSTPSGSEFGSSATEFDDEKKMDRSFNSAADFKDSSDAERCEAPDYAELFGFQMGDLQDRMDRQTFGQTPLNHSCNDSPTESVDGATSSGDATSAAGNTFPIASASFHSTTETFLAPVQSSCDQIGSSSIYPVANAVPMICSAEQGDCQVTAVCSPLSDSYILTPSPANSTPLNFSLSLPPLSPGDCMGGSTDQPDIASTTHNRASSQIPGGSNSCSATYRRSSMSRPLPYPDASSICKLGQLVGEFDGSASNTEDATVIGMECEQQVAFMLPSSSAECTTLPSQLSPGMRKSHLSSSVERHPANRMEEDLVLESDQSESTSIPLRCGSPLPPRSQWSRFPDCRSSLLLQHSSQLQNFEAMGAYNRFPQKNDLAGSTVLTPPTLHHPNRHSAFHSHIPNLNSLQPPQFMSLSNFSYLATPAPRRNSDCQSNILTPPPSVERNHAQSCNSQTVAYPFSYWIGPYDQNPYQIKGPRSWIS